MGDKKPVPVKAPFQQQQEQKNTYGTMSVADSPEARALLDTPLDFGSGGADIKTDFDLDPGVGRRTDLAEQSAADRWDSAFMSGVPAWMRQASREKELREIRGQGAAERQQAEYGRQQAEYGASVTKANMASDAATRRTMADLERRRLLLPQIVQTGGSGSSSGYNTQVVQPQPGFWQNLAVGAASGLAGNAKI